MDTTTLPGRSPIRPIDLSEARELLQEKFASKEFWTMIVHGSATGLLVEIETKFYSGDRNQDFTLVTYIEDNEVFAVVCARKKWMLAYQLSSMLRRFSEVKISEKNIHRRDLAIIAPG